MATKNVLFLLAVALGASVGCRRPDPKLKDVGNQNRLTLPTNEGAQTPFRLDGDTPGGTYVGSVLVWENDATPEAVAEVAHWSNQHKVREARVHRAKSELEVVDLKIAEASADSTTAERDAEAERLEKQQEIDLQYSEVVREHERQRFEQASGWAERELTRLAEQGLIPSLDNTLRRYSYFCEGKLWQFALNPYLLDKTFKARPMPFAGCERVLAPLFAEIPQCESGSGRRSYFSCVWLAAMRTQIFAEGFVPSQQDAASLERFAKQKAFFKRLVERADSDFLRLLHSPTYPRMKVRNLRFHDAALRAEDGTDLNGFEYCRAASCPARDPHSPGKDLFAVTEGLELINLAGGAKFFGVDEPSAGAPLPQPLNAFLATLGAFAARPENVSVSDVIFNAPLGGDYPPTSSLPGWETRVQTIADSTLEDVTREATGVPVAETSEAALVKIAALKTAIAANKDRRLQLNEDLRAAEAAVSEALLRGSAAAKAPGTGSAHFNGVRLDITPKGDLIQVMLTFQTSAREARGCLLRFPVSEVSCPDAMDSQDVLTDLSFDSVLSELRFAWSIHGGTSAAEYGLEQKDRVAGNAAFNDITTATWEGARWEYRLAFTRIDNTLDVLTGEAKIVDADMAREAGMTFIRFDK